MIRIALTTPTESTPGLGRNDIKRLFELLIPTLPGSRFQFSDGVLCDRGTDRPNFAVQDDIIIDKNPLKFFTHDTTQRRIGLAIANIWDREDSFGAADLGSTVAETVKLAVVDSPCERVPSNIALLLVLLERTFSVQICPEKEWEPLFRALLADGVRIGECPIVPGSWLQWLRRIIPDNHSTLLDDVRAATGIAGHIGTRVLETAPTATPPRKRNLELEKMRQRANHLKDKIGSIEKGTRTRGHVVHK